MDERKLELEAAAVNHFDGVGAVLNMAVSFSDEEEDSEGCPELGEFIDGGGSV